MLIRRAALVLRIEAMLLFFISIALVANPEIITKYLELPPASVTAEVKWTFRVIGVLLLLPALLGPLVAAFAGERGLRQAAAGMAFISLGMGSAFLISPLGLTLQTFTVAAIWYFFALLYFYALRGRGRNR